MEKCEVQISEPGRGYYMDMVGKNARRITEYIKNQLKDDARSDQLAMEIA